MLMFKIQVNTDNNNNNNNSIYLFRVKHYSVTKLFFKMALSNQNGPEMTFRG